MKKTPLGLIVDSHSLTGIVEISKYAESAGFHSVWATELYRTAFQQLAAIAQHTSKIKLGSSVALAFVRSPLITAISAMDIDEASDGRLILGLGSGARRTNEMWHGQPHGKPVTRIKECVDVIRRVICGSHTGSDVTYGGEYYDINIKGFTRPFKPVRTDVPIFLAAVGGAMAGAAALCADGYIGHIVCSKKYIEETVVPALRDGLASAGRERSDFCVSSIFICAVCGKNGLEEARRAAKATVAFYATVKTYWRPFTLHGFIGQAEKIRDAYFKGNLQAMIENVTDDMLDTFAIVGTADECRNKLDGCSDYLDLPILSAPHYYLGPEQVEMYQKRIIETFGG